MNTLAINHLNYQYNDKLLIKDFSLTLKPGITTLVGPSGCGKSTLIKLIIDNYQNINRTNNISYMTQNNLFFSWLTMEKNIELFIKLNPNPSLNYQQYINNLDLKKYLNLYPHQLSGGTLRKFAFLIMFIKNSDLILLDEPFNGIDEFKRKEYYELLLNNCQDKCVLLITHNIQEALQVSNTIITLTTEPMTIKNIYTKDTFNYQKIYQDLVFSA